ncbi:alpha/beta fold hydrolase [Nonomuraea sp. NPDC050783]|uniref:alpha/beta fold hydrolase n=1 Tax=Nonomuraea sp. NPDC050783 TaxID=3154634 RepID=UPI0034679735
MSRLPGMAFRDHVIPVPLVHGVDGSPEIEVFAREVVAAGREGDDLPWLCFLNGGPGSKAPRPPAPGWLAVALRTHRVLLLDQRGTGRSTPLHARTAAGRTDAELATYIGHLRADSIVADAELVRRRLAGDRPWTTLGQSYGGFVTMTYLSVAPEGLAGCLVAGGVPPLTATAAEVYTRLYPRVAAKNAALYRRYPEDVDRVRRIVGHLAAHDVRLPDGDRLDVARFRSLGKLLGSGDGLEQLHWLVEDAWHGDDLSDSFRYAVMAATGFVDDPLFALQEYIYGAPGRPTGWAAEEELARHPEFAADADPVLFTGEMMYRWMFAEIRALRPFAGAADLLATTCGWPALYDLERLARNEVPVAAAVYFDDMHMDAGLQLETVARVGNMRAWVTNEYEHDGLAASGGAVLEHLLDMIAGRR